MNTETRDDDYDETEAYLDEFNAYRNAAYGRLSDWEIRERDADRAIDEYLGK